MSIDLEIPWVEKYRPKDFDDIVSQNLAINNLKEFVERGNMPHMIFAGPAGTGKTSAALIIAKKLLKEDNYYRDLLELNSSDVVRMEYVRSVMKNFVGQNMMKTQRSLKLIILDEADNIPTQVQQTLRRIIEKSSDHVKFILLCNYIDRIIDPIISRCAVFRFVNLSKEKVIDRLKYIAKQEKISIPVDKANLFYNSLYFISEGDLRKAINTFQSAVALELIENLDIDEILKISGYLDDSTLGYIISAIKAKSFIKVREILKNVENFDSRNILRQIITFIPELKINQTDLNLIYSIMGDIDYRISQGANEEIQILAFVAELIEMVDRTSN
jgi:replication factor C small subunit